MGWDLVVLLVAPFAVAVVCWLAPAGVGRALTLASGAGTFVLALLLVPETGPTRALSGWLRADALSVVFVVTVAFVYLATAVFSLGYLRPSGGAAESLRYSRRFYAGLHVFAWSMIMAPLVDSLALLWIAIEVTTVVSALLVAIDGTDGASEAAWKYVLIASMGLGIALLATVVMYFAGTSVFGGSYR
ncbi:MAG: proton-conducting transporter membrane subunit, partial [Acidimicrobiales bacterium]